MLADLPVAELTGDQLHARLAWAQVYLVRSHESESTTEAPPEWLMSNRIDYLRRLESAGRLYAHGSVEALPKDNVRELAIIAAASAEEANRIATDDPLHNAGYRTNTVQSHIINEGIACYVARAMSRRVLAEAETSRAVKGAAAPDAGGAESGQGVELYLISLEPTDKPRPVDATDHAHFVWLRENEMAARLMSCGPVEPAGALGPGIWPGGLGVVATSRDEAERIADSEPSGRAGFRAVSIRGWTVRQGIAAPIARVLHRLNALPT